jgi:DDE superfamily endonuclease/Helix-turn-helix of DDE superfamily endonuclease
MFRYDQLAQQPSSFRSLTGVSVSEFKELFTRFEPVWQALERQRLQRRTRQRKIGGGRKYELDLKSQVVMTLVWIHLYLTTETLGILFDLSKSAISRNTRRVVGALRQVGRDSVWWQEPPAKNEGKTLPQALAENPDLLAILDVMEVTVQRPQGGEQQKAHYSGKKKAHTRKVGILVNEQGRIRGVTDSRPGRIHDLTVFRQSGILGGVPEDTCMIGDKAFQGLQNDWPNHSVGTPFKPGKKTPLTEAECWANRDLSRQRIMVENSIAELRHFKILAERFRHAMAWVTAVVFAVVAVVNQRIAHRLATAA